MTNDEKVAFDVYFASIAAMQFHPGAGTKEHIQLNVVQCRDMALKMLELRRDVMSSEES